MTSHPDVEALAFFAEGLLDPAEERSVAAHIETCATCATTLDELTGVTLALAAAPAPAFPDHVADLLDQRLGDAVRERAAQAPAPGAPAATGAPEDSSGATVTPLTRKKRGLGMSRLLVAAAAAVFVVGGGAALLNSALSTGSGDAGSAAPLVGQEDEEARAEAEGTPHTVLAYTPVVRSETVYTDGALAEQAAELLDLTADETEGTGQGSTEGADELFLQEDPPGVHECATRFGEALDTEVTLVDDAHYGPDAERVWVLYAPDDDRVDVYVVDPRCARGGDATRSVLAEETVPAR